MPAKSKSKASKHQNPPQTKQEPSATPNWPPLQPLVPSTDLSLATLLPDQIVVVRNFFPASLCKTYVSFLSTLNLTTTPGTPKKGDAVRVNDRFQVQDAAFAERLWSGTSLKELVLACEHETSLWGGQVLGLNPNIRIYRYRPGQFFDQHYDDSNNLMFTPAGAAAQVQAKTTWTLLIYLTRCDGGETVFYPERRRGEDQAQPVVVGLEVGMALLHRHGEKCMLHEGKEVLRGEKWVIRSDLVVRR